jgi:hypothetical protein
MTVAPATTALHWATREKPFAEPSTFDKIGPVIGLRQPKIGTLLSHEQSSGTGQYALKEAVLFGGFSSKSSAGHSHGGV